jgi:hypothetical protein
MTESRLQADSPSFMPLTSLFSWSSAAVVRADCAIQRSAVAEPVLTPATFVRS